jgi:hypothetical protein
VTGLAVSRCPRTFRINPVEDIAMRATPIAIAAILCITVSASAQTTSSGANVTFVGGYAGFLDDAIINHGVAGAGAEWVFTPRLAVGPEVLYMIGPDSDRDLFVLGVARFGIRPFSTAVAPYVVAGGGLMRHSNRFGGRSFSSTEGAFIVGGGVLCELPIASSWHPS